MVENRAGQPFTASWHLQVTSDDGEKRKYDLEGTKFWCAPTQAKRCSRSFRSNIEGKQITLILGSTNVSKLKGIDRENDIMVIFKNSKYRVEYVEYDEFNQRYTVALK
jgi:hypothetical protein